VLAEVVVDAERELVVAEEAVLNEGVEGLAPPREGGRVAGRVRVLARGERRVEELDAGGRVLGDGGEVGVQCI